MTRLRRADRAGRSSRRAVSRRRCAPATLRRTNPRRWGGAIRDRELSAVGSQLLGGEGWLVKKRAAKLPRVVCPLARARCWFFLLVFVLPGRNADGPSA